MPEGELVSFPNVMKAPGAGVFFRNLFGRSFPVTTTQLLLCYLSRTRLTSGSAIPPSIRQVAGSPDTPTYRTVWLDILAIILTAGVVLLSAAAARAQVYGGSLTGVATDPSGAVVPGAAVVLTDDEKGFQYTATT